jgi:hypothetical protein
MRSRTLLKKFGSITAQYTETLSGLGAGGWGLGAGAEAGGQKARDWL